VASFSDLFDVSKIDDHQLGHIEWVLTSPSYMDVFRPFLLRAKESAIELLLDHSEGRRREWSDDALIERANSIRELLTFFDKLVEEAQQERIIRAQSERQDRTDYNDMARGGYLDPTPGRTPSREIPPELDF
jgi:hypothetical protein